MAYEVEAPAPETAAVAREKARIEREYRRREAEIDEALYAPWNAAESAAVAERRLAAAQMLAARGAFPRPGQKALEVGYGKLGWLADLLAWGLCAPDLAGIELDAARAARAQAALPGADLRTGDATRLPWPDETFDLIVVSTVFSSILSADVRALIAREIERALAPAGAILWYDLRVDNPRNANVRGIAEKELRALFPALRVDARRVTLAPPLARRVAPRSAALAAALAAVPFLRTHLVAVLTK